MDMTANHISNVEANIEEILQTHKFFFFFFLPYLWHGEVPGPGIEPVPQQQSGALQ